MLEWIRENPTLFALLIWPLFTGTVSTMYKYADGVPRLHAVLSVMVGAGLDLPKVLDALRRALTGEDPPAPPQMKNVGSVRQCKDVRDPPPVCRRVAWLLAAALCLTGCSWLTTSHVVDVVQLAECVLVESAKVAPDRLPTIAEAAQVAFACGAKDAQQILDILTAEKKANAIRTDYAAHHPASDAGAKP